VCNVCCARIERRHVPMREQIWGSGVRGGGGVGTRRREAQCQCFPQPAGQSCAGLEAALPIAAPAPGSDSSVAERRSRIGRRWRKRGKQQRKRGEHQATSKRGKQQSLPGTANGERAWITLRFWRDPRFFRRRTGGCRGERDEKSVRGLERLAVWLWKCLSSCLSGR
jgi:hypothetical protein